MSIFDERNLSMMMDLYEMTMSNGYHKEACGHDRATFDVFFRRVPDDGGYAIFAGLEQVVDFIEHMHFDEPDIEYFRSQPVHLVDEPGNGLGIAGDHARAHNHGVALAHP